MTAWRFLDGPIRYVKVYPYRYTEAVYGWFVYDGGHGYLASGAVDPYHQPLIMGYNASLWHRLQLTRPRRRLPRDPRAGQPLDRFRVQPRRFRLYQQFTYPRCSNRSAIYQRVGLIGSNASGFEPPRVFNPLRSPIRNIATDSLTGCQILVSAIAHHPREVYLR